MFIGGDGHGCHRGDLDSIVYILEKIAKREGIGDLLHLSEMIWHLNRMFNKREIPDFGRKYDYPSPRFYEEPIPSGPNKGHKVEFSVIEEMLDAYYAARGWDANGIPTKETMEKFNLAVE